MRTGSVGKKIDDIDKKILNLILRKSNLSCRQIGRQIGISAVTALKRIKALEKEKIIKSYTAELDYEKLGYDITTIIKIRIAKGMLFQVEKKIATNPNVFAVYDVTGDFDAITISRFRNRKSMDAFLKKIQTYDFVERTETQFVLNSIKERVTSVD